MGRIREVIEPDLHHVLAAKALLEELANGRTIADAIAHIEVGVEGNQAPVGEVISGQSAESAPGKGVVTTEQLPGGRSMGRHECAELGSARGVGIVNIAVVHY